jgi:phosphate transport system protein
MQRHFEQELDGLKTSLIKMASIVEEAIGNATQAVQTRDTALAESIISSDSRVNSLEIEIDNSIFDLLALQQPVAVDLRFILSAHKINNDLERLGDHAVNIAESALALAGFPAASSLYVLPDMSRIARDMLRLALDGFIHRDPALGKKVLERDDEIDRLNREMTVQVITQMKAGTETVEVGLELIRVSKNLERTADLATNIAEDVIFITQARVVKHHAADRTDQT